MGRSKFSNYIAPLILSVMIIAVIGVALLAGGSDKSTPKPKPKEVVNTECGPYRKDGIVMLNGQQINVEIAYTSTEKTKGLSGRPCIGSNWGMLFDFGRDGQYAFWMKDMKFPIDVIWINSAHNIGAIEVNFTPASFPEKRVNQNPARYILELKANKSKELKLDLGTPVRFKNT